MIARFHFGSTRKLVMLFIQNVLSKDDLLSLPGGFKKATNSVDTGQLKLESSKFNRLYISVHSRAHLISFTA